MIFASVAENASTLRYDQSWAFTTRRRKSCSTGRLTAIAASVAAR